MTEEHKKKIGLANLGKTRLYSKGDLNPAKRQDVRLKISMALKGKPKSLEHINNLRLAKIGSKVSNETRLKMSIAAKKNVAKGTHHLWQGGVNQLHKSERNLIVYSLEYKLWREAVFVRDNFICVFCGQKNKKIHADHIKPFRDYPELRLSIDNGRTLCVECHRKTDTYGRHS